jgi:tryptophanase
VRGIEVGTLMADKDPVTHQNRYPDLETVRLAIPRRVYSDNHMDYVAVVVRNVFERRDQIKRGLKIIWEAQIMRHFTVKLERL